MLFKGLSEDRSQAGRTKRRPSPKSWEKPPKRGVGNSLDCDKSPPRVRKNTLLLREADAANIRPTELEWKTMERKYLSQLDTLKTEMGLTGADLTDTTVSAGERQKVAGLKMEQYFDNLIAGKTTLRPLPSALASLLRERLPFRIDQAGMSRAMDIAKEAKAEADSAEGAGSPVRRAPGGPPIPGAGALPRMPGQAGSPRAPAPGATTPAPTGADSAARKQ